MKSSLFYLALFLFTLTFISSPNYALADGGRFGVNIDAGYRVGGLYYNEDNTFTVGTLFDFGFSESSATIDGSDNTQSQFGITVFARKNFMIYEKTYLGFGGGFSYDWNNLKDTVDGSGHDTVFSIGPTAVMDYHLTDHVILTAGMSIVTFRWADRVYGDSKSVDFLDPFVAVALMF